MSPRPSNAANRGPRRRADRRARRQVYRRLDHELTAATGPTPHPLTAGAAATGGVLPRLPRFFPVLEGNHYFPAESIDSQYLTRSRAKSLCPWKEVASVIRTWGVTREDLDQLFAEQGRRWQQEARGTRHEGDVEHYCAQVTEERGLVEEILAVIHRLASVTIEKLLAKSDLEVGVEALLSGSPPSRGIPDPDVRQRPEDASE